MVDDHADYLPYAFRRWTLQAFEELISMMDDKLYQNRYVIKNAYNYLRLAHKVAKLRDSEKEKHNGAMEVYKLSKEYENLMKELQKLEDEDEYKTDTDPEGYFSYGDLIDGKLDLSEFVIKICAKNQDAPDLQGKSIKYFLRPQADGKTRAHASASKFFAAVRAAVNLRENHKTHPRYVSGLAYLFAFWINYGAEIKAVIGDERLYDVAANEIKELGCPVTIEDVRKWAIASAEGTPANIRVANELLKLDKDLFGQVKPDAEAVATEVLLKQAEQLKSSTVNGLPKLRVWDAVALHKTLKKIPNFTDAKFKQTAKEMFAHSTYFQ